MRIPARVIPAPRRHRGFSLIEVLIAAAVMAVGLMALAALQASIARNAADARARSQIASFADLVVERQRSAASGGFDSVPATDQWTDAELDAVEASAGVSDLTVTLASTHFEGRSGLFVACDAACGAALPESAPQYKQLRVETSWRDVSGNLRNFNVLSVLSPRTVGDSRLPYNSATAGNAGSNKRPVVRSDTPVQTGVIPIAIGTNTDTAATNPRPEVAGRRNNEEVVGTSYEVLTYRSEGSDTVQTQRRVETKVIACTCASDAAPTGDFAATAQWPAFWNGERYTVYNPDDDDPAPGADKNTGAKTGVTQDELCTDCCRDHHDGVGEGDVKFDPYRDDHQHFKLVDGLLVPAEEGDDYIEACRMIRVDGFWRTATDLDAKHFGLIATINDARSAVPTATAVGLYEDFVLDFLNAKYTPGSSELDADDLYQAKGLNAPTELSIARPPTLDTRYLHSRGLYVDNIEQVALDKMQKAVDNCPTGTPVSECLLPLVPFTSINTTELAFWSASNTSALSVSNDSSLVFNPDLPTRGRVNALTGAETNATGAAVADMRKSNSGVAVYFTGVDDEDEVTLRDSQNFRVPGSPNSSDAGTFTTVLSGLPQTSDINVSNDPGVAWNIDGLSDNCIASYAPKKGNVPADTNPNPYACNVFSDLPADATLTVQSYNQVDEASETVSITCTVGQESASATVAARYCVNYGVSAVTINGVTASYTPTVINDGSITGEATELQLSSVDESDVIGVSFTQQGRTRVEAFTCTLGASGNGRNRTITVSTVTWAACP